jgi:hypothetical protein
MDIQKLKSEFLAWTTTTGHEMKIKDPFLLGCLDNAIEENIDSTINGVPFYQHYSKDELMIQILTRWQSCAGSFLQLPVTNVHFVFRENPLPGTEEGRKTLLEELSAYINSYTGAN